jgi:hypothetical protein
VSEIDGDRMLHHVALEATTVLVTAQRLLRIAKSMTTGVIGWDQPRIERVVQRWIVRRMRLVRLSFQTTGEERQRSAQMGK